MMKKRIVVKVGSNVLTRADGNINVTRVSAIVDQIVWLRKHGYEPILVSSGSLACGRGSCRPAASSTACSSGSYSRLSDR